MYEIMKEPSLFVIFLANMNAGVNNFSYIFIKWLQRDGSFAIKIGLIGCFTVC